MLCFKFYNLAKRQWVSHLILFNLSKENVILIGFCKVSSSIIQYPPPTMIFTVFTVPFSHWYQSCRFSTKICTLKQHLDNVGLGPAVVSGHVVLLAADRWVVVSSSGVGPRDPVPGCLAALAGGDRWPYLISDYNNGNIHGPHHGHSTWEQRRLRDEV